MTVIRRDQASPTSRAMGAEFRPVTLFGHPRQEGLIGRWLADWDLLVLMVVILADVRVFQGSSVASFTLYEIFVWGYCCPFVIGRIIRSRGKMAPLYARFVFLLGCYLAWVVFAAVVALAAQHDSEVLQEAKNIVPALPLVCFIFVRITRYESIAKLANVYIVYCIAATLLGLVQFTHGGPYVRPVDENNDFKLDLAGELVDNVVLGFSTTPNELAVVLLPGVMFAAMKLVDELRGAWRPRLITLACCATCGTGLVLAQSRGALAWFALGFAFMSLPTRKSRSFLLKLSLVCAMIVVLVLVGLRADPNADIDNTVVGRLLLWVTSLQAMASDSYIALLGDGVKYVQLWSYQIAGWQYPDAHNGWIDQALFFGAPAFVLYLAIWRQFFSISDAAGERMGRRERLMLDCLRATVLAFMGLNFFEPVAHSVFPVSQLFLLMSCAIVLVQLYGNSVVATMKAQPSLDATRP